MARAPEIAAKLTSILWASLAYIGKKRTDRTLIDVGQTKVDVTIVGKVGRSKVSEHIVGTLVQSPEQTKASNVAAPTDLVVALILDRFSESDRHAVMQELLDAWSATKSLPEVPAEQLKSAKQFLAELRAKKTTTVAGALAFELAPGKE